jgi:hypothetical protein
MMDNKRITRITGLVIFLITWLVYLLTVQASVSFWDPGEISACAYGLEVPHPPGGPLWSLIGHVAMLLPFLDRGFRFNLVSTLLTSFTVLFLYHIAVMLIRNWRKSHSTVADFAVINGSAALGALTYAFCDTAWFNGGETNYFSGSIFFVSFVMWVALKWFENASQPHSGRYLMLIAYLIGLSIGVHQLSLLSFFAVAFLVYSRYYEITPKSFVAFGIVAVLLFFMIFPGVVTWLPSLLGGKFKLGSIDIRDSGTLPIVFFVIIGGLIYIAYYAQKNKNLWLSAGSLCILFIILGYSTYATIMIRANAHPPINENNPSTLERFIPYFEREQYGEHPTINLDKEKYGGKLFPRRWSTEPDKAAYFKNYKSDWDYFWTYQLNHMYLRYLGFNFVGRSGDIQDAPVEFLGNNSKDWTDSPKGFPNKYFAIPMILGLLGVYYHFRKDWKMGFAMLTLFFMTGLALVLYFNMQKEQPRERDYFYAGSFFVFSMWIGFGVAAILEYIEEKIQNRPKLPALLGCALGICFLIAPVNMIRQNWFDHDRSRNYVPWDFAYNLLQSCEKDAVVFTNGDNDTFPLWYLQEVEGVRTDVRVVNLSLVNTDWYTLQLKNEEPHGAKKVAFTFSDDQIIDIASKGGMLWDTKELDLAVPEEVLREFGVTDTNIINRGKITFKMTSTYPGGKAIRTQDAMVRSIVEGNKWERPIYFAVTVDIGRGERPGSAIGLGEYLRMEGLAFRLTPAKRNAAISETISRDAMRGHLMEEPTGFFREPHKGFKLRGLNDPNIFLDENVRRLCSNYRQAFISLAGYYVNVEKNKEEAVKVLEKLEEKLPPSLIPVDYVALYIVSSLYTAAGRPDKASPLNDMVEKLCLSNIEKNPAAVPQDYWNPYAVLLEIYTSRKDYRKEMDLWTKLYALYPNDQSIKERIAQLQTTIDNAKAGTATTDSSAITQPNSKK